MNYDYPTAFSSWRYGDNGPEHKAIDRVLKSDRLTMGPEVEAFEEEFAAYHSRRHCIAVNSGSSANLVAASALNYGWYKNIVGFVPAIAWSTTYAPFIKLGKDFRVVDVDETWNVKSYGAMNYSPGFIVDCSILGNPGYTHNNHFDVPVLEDNCESLGSRRVDGKLTGTFGDLSTSSFFYSHQLSAIEGGAILTDDDDLARLCRLLCNHGNDGWGKDDFEKSYNFIVFGYNLRMQEINAAIAREQLKQLYQFIHLRNWNLKYFVYNTEGLPIVHQKTQGAPSPFGLAFTCESKDARGRLAAALRANGIDCRPPTGGSFTKHSYGSQWRSQPTPNADKIHDCGIFLGNAPWPIPKLIDQAIKVMRNVL